MINRRLLGERVAVRVHGCPSRDGVLISGVKKETKLIQKFPVRFPNGDVRTYRGDQLLLRGTKASLLDFIRVGDILYTKKTLGVVRFVGMHEDFKGPVIVIESIDPRLPADKTVTSFSRTFPSAVLIDGGSYNLIRKLEDILKLLPPDTLITQISKIKDKYSAFKTDMRKKEQRYEAEKDKADNQISELETKVVEHAAAKGKGNKRNKSQEENVKESVLERASVPKSEIMFNEIIFHPGLLGIQATWSTGKIEGVSEHGQASQLGVEAGWRITHIDGEPYYENLLDQKTQGSEDYLLTFEIPRVESTIVDPIKNENSQTYTHGGASMEDTISKTQRDNYRATISELNEKIHDFQSTVESLRGRADELVEEHKEFTKVRVKVEQLRVSRKMFMGQIKEMQKREKEWKTKAAEFEKKYNMLLKERASVNVQVRETVEPAGGVRNKKNIHSPAHQKKGGRSSKRKYGRLPIPDASNTVKLGSTPKVGEGSSQSLSMSDLKRMSTLDKNKLPSSSNKRKKRPFFKG